MTNPIFNSIQDGSCCRDCFRTGVQDAFEKGILVAVSERFRITATQVVEAVRNHLDGLPQDPCREDEYIDRYIIRVDDPRDPTVHEILIISANLQKADCFCTNE
jgi:hypothetical protein